MINILILYISATAKFSHSFFYVSQKIYVYNTIICEIEVILLIYFTIFFDDVLFLSNIIDCEIITTYKMNKTLDSTFQLRERAKATSKYATWR